MNEYKMKKLYEMNPDKKIGMWQTIVFGWIIQGMPKKKNEFERADDARSLIKRFKQEILQDVYKDISANGHITAEEFEKHYLTPQNGGSKT